MGVAVALGYKEQAMDLNEGQTLGELVSLLLEDHGEALEAQLLEMRDPITLLPFMHIYVNGRDPSMAEGFRTILHEGDDVMIMPRLSGG